MSTGAFITLEGGEGAGKSTCMARVLELLRSAGLPVVETREPGGTPLGEELRRLLLGAGNEVGAEAELLLMFAARAQNIRQVIRPALERGQWVVCDRFTDASFAYQGGGRGLDRDAIAWLEQWIQGSLQPDLTLLLDVSPELGLRRATGDREPDRFETEQAAFYERVRAAYHARAAEFPERFRIIDASRPLEQVVAELETVLKEFLEERR